jgi:hypothetical protein
MISVKYISLKKVMYLSVWRNARHNVDYLFILGVGIFVNALSGNILPKTLASKFQYGFFIF